MLTLTINNSTYEVTDCYNTTMYNKALVAGQPSSVQNFAVANLSANEVGNQAHLTALSALVGQENLAVITNESNVAVLTLDTTYTFTNFNKQIDTNGLATVSLNFSKN